MTRNRQLDAECRELKREHSRLQAEAGQPDLRAVTSEVMRTARTVIQRHVEEHPAMRQLIARGPIQLAATLRDLPLAVAPDAHDADQTVEDDSGISELRSSDTVSQLSVPSTVTSAEATSMQVRYQNIIGPSSRYRLVASEVRSPDSPRSKERTLRRQLSDEDLGGHRSSVGSKGSLTASPQDTERHRAAWI